MSLLPDNEPPRGAAHDGAQPPAFTAEDIYSLLPGRTVSMRVIEEFFRSQFEACLRQEKVEANLELCLVFGPDTWADLRRLVLGGGQAGAGQQGFPALERFCREHDIASKQYLLLPLLTPGHGSLLILCQRPHQPAGGKAAGSLPPLSDMQDPLLLHLDSLSGGLPHVAGQGSLKGHQPDCAALVRFLRPYLNMSYHKLETMAVLTASVPQQGSSGVGATFLCTSALYFAASLPPILYAEDVVRLKNYKQEPVDMYELRDDGEPWYPGFLTTDWYPRNVPEAMRKLLLSGIVNQLQGQSSQPDAAVLLEQAGQVQKALHKASARQFGMPAERLLKQLEMKRGRQLAAGRRIWEKGTPDSGSEAYCERGRWSVYLTKEMLDGAGLCFADVEHIKSTKGYKPPNPQQFEICFGVRLNPGQRPPPFVVHIRPKPAQCAAAAPDQAELQLEMRFASEPAVTSKGAGWVLEKTCWESLRSHLGTALQPGNELRLVQRPGTGGKAGTVHVDLEVQFREERQAELEELRQLDEQALERRKQALEERATVPGAARPNLNWLAEQERIARPVRPRSSQQTAGTAITPDAAQLSGGTGGQRGTAGTPVVDAAHSGQGSQAGGAPAVSLGGPNGGPSSLRQATSMPEEAVIGSAGGAQQEAATPGLHDPTQDAPGSPQQEAATADPADMAAASSLAALHSQLFWGTAGDAAAAAALRPTAKGVKRLQTGSDSQGDRRARLTVRGKKYYAGYFPTGAAAAQAEDLMVLWVHYSAAGWPAGWMQSCSSLNHKLNYPYAFHLATHERLVASLGSCADNDALRQLLQRHLNAGGQQPDDAEPSLQPASQGGLPASPRGEQSAAAAAPPAVERMQLGAQQHAATGAGEKRPADSAAAGSSLDAKRQRGGATSGEHLERTQSLRSSGTGRDAQQQQAQQQGLGQQVAEGAAQQRWQRAVLEGQQVEQMLLQPGELGAQQFDQAEQALLQVQQGLQQAQQAGLMPASPASQQQAAEQQAMDVDAAAALPEHPLAAAALQQPPQQAATQPEQQAQVLPPQVLSWGSGKLLPAVAAPSFWKAAGRSPGLAAQSAALAAKLQQAQPDKEASSTAGAGAVQPRPASSAVVALRAMLQGGSSDSGPWTDGVRRQAASALSGRKVAASESDLIAAQIDGIIAALAPLGVPFSARLACTRRFRQLPAVDRSALLAELRHIALLGSMADLLDWMQEVDSS